MVDDSRPMRKIARRVLRRAGHSEDSIDEAENGWEALDIIRAGATDLVISDWHMPVMTGIELLHHIKAEGIVVKFGFVTVDDTAEKREQAIAGGALFLLAKPLTQHTFEEFVAKLL